MSDNKNIMLEFDPEDNSKYYQFIEQYRKERSLSFTAASKQLLLQKIDELIEKDKNNFNVQEIEEIIIRTINSLNLPNKTEGNKDNIKVDEPNNDNLLKNLGIYK